MIDILLSMTLFKAQRGACLHAVYRNLRPTLIAKVEVQPTKYWRFRTEARASKNVRPKVNLASDTLKYKIYSVGWRENFLIHRC